MALKDTTLSTLRCIITPNLCCHPEISHVEHLPPWKICKRMPDHVLIAGRTHCHITTDTQYIIVNVNVHYRHISSCYNVHVASVRWWKHTHLSCFDSVSSWIQRSFSQ